MLIKWKWNGDIYSLEAFQIALTGDGRQPTPEYIEYSYIYKVDIAYIKEENILIDGGVIFEYEINDALVNNHNIWIRPLFYNINGTWFNYNNNTTFSSPIDIPIINRSYKYWKNKLYNFDITKIDGNSIETGSITCDKVRGNIGEIGGLNGEKGSIEVYGQGLYCTIANKYITINENGIMIEAGKIKMMDKKNLKTLIDENGIYLLNITAENVIINREKKLILLNKDGIYDKNGNILTPNTNIITIDQDGLKVYNYNDECIVNINNNGIRIDSGVLKVKDKNGQLYFSGEGVDIKTININNLIMNDINGFNGIQINDYNTGLNYLNINSNGIFIYDIKTDTNEQILRTKLNEDGLVLFGKYLDEKHQEIETTIIDKNGISCSFLNTGKLTLKNNPYIKIYNNNNDNIITITHNEIVLNNILDETNKKLIINNNGIQINQSFFTLDLDGRGDVAFDDEGRLYIDYLCGNIGDKFDNYIKLFDNAIIRYDNFGIALIYNNNNKIRVENNFFKIFFEKMNYPVFGLRW